MSKAKGSRLLNVFSEPFFGLWKALGTAGTVTFLASLYPFIESHLTRKKRKSKYTPHFFLRAAESSYILGGGGRLIAALGEVSLGTYGQAGVLYGMLSTGLWFAMQSRASVTNLIVSLGLMLASVPIMHVGAPLSAEIGNSRLFGRFLFDFCGCPRPEIGQNVRRPLRRSMIIALLFAILSIWIPVWKQLLFLLIGAALYLLFRIPELGVCTLLLFFPFLNLFPSPTKLLLIVVVLLSVAWFKKAVCGRRALHFDLLDRFVLLLIALYLLGGLVGAGGTAGGLEGGMRAGLLLVWFPVRNLLENPRWRRRARISLCTSAAVIAFLGIAEYFFAGGELLFVDPERFGMLGSRVCATFSNPNYLATYLVLCAPMFAVGIFDDTRAVRCRFWEGIGLFSVLLCIILTWTRGAWLGIAVAALLFLLLCSRGSFTLLMLSPILLAFAFPFLPSSVVSRFASIKGGDSSVHYRLYTWMGVKRMLDAYPFGIGVGEQAFRAVYPQFAVSGTERVMHAHRLDLQLLSELGWIGFGVFGLFFVLLFLRMVYGMYSLNGKRRRTLLGCFCALIGALVMSAFDYIWYHFGNFTLFFILAAWGISVMKDGEKTG